MSYKAMVLAASVCSISAAVLSFQAPMDVALVGGCLLLVAGSALVILANVRA